MAPPETDEHAPTVTQVIHKQLNLVKNATLNYWGEKSHGLVVSKKKEKEKRDQTEEATLGRSSDHQ